MFNWRPKRDKRFETKPTSDEIHADKSPRIGRRGICIKCGDIKTGSFVPCPTCKFQPVNEHDLTLSLALNEVHQANQFFAMAHAVHHGAKPQLRSADYEKLLREVRESGIKRMLGLDQETYVLQDKLEIAISAAADQVCISYESFIQDLYSEFGEVELNELVAFVIVTLAAELGLFANIEFAPHKQYAISAFPYRVAHCLLRSGMVGDDDDSKSPIANSFFELYQKTKELVLPVFDQNEAECDSALAHIIFGSDSETLANYERSNRLFLTKSLEAITHRFDQRLVVR